MPPKQRCIHSVTLSAWNWHRLGMFFFTTDYPSAIRLLTWREQRSCHNCRYGRGAISHRTYQTYSAAEFPLHPDRGRVYWSGDSQPERCYATCSVCSQRCHPSPLWVGPMAMDLAMGPGAQDMDLGRSSQLGNLVPRGRLGVVGYVWSDNDQDVQAVQDQKC